MRFPETHGRSQIIRPVIKRFGNYANRTLGRVNSVFASCDFYVHWLYDWSARFHLANTRFSPGEEDCVLLTSKWFAERFLNLDSFSTI